MSKSEYSQILLSSAIIGLLLSLLGYLGVDNGFASSHWLIISGILGVFGVYSRFQS